MARTKSLRLDAIRLDGDTQPRTEIDYDVVAEYAELYRLGCTLPPLVAFFDGASYWLADGFHRLYAAHKQSLESVQCEVHTGSLDDARWFSYAANQAHGIRRTNADKAKAVKSALRHPAGVKLSDRQIAEHVGVDDKTVAKYRAELEATAEIPHVEKRTGKDGRTTNTERIGSKPEASKPEPVTVATVETCDDEPVQLSNGGYLARLSNNIAEAVIGLGAGPVVAFLRDRIEELESSL